MNHDEMSDVERLGWETLSRLRSQLVRERRARLFRTLALVASALLGTIALGVTIFPLESVDREIIRHILGVFIPLLTMIIGYYFGTESSGVAKQKGLERELHERLEKARNLHLREHDERQRK